MIIWRNTLSSINSRSFKSVGCLLMRNAQPDNINTTLLNNILKMRLHVFFQPYFQKTYIFMIFVSILGREKSRWFYFAKTGITIHGVAGGWVSMIGHKFYHQKAGRLRIGCPLTPSLLCFPLDHIFPQDNTIDVIYCAVLGLTSTVHMPGLFAGLMTFIVTLALMWPMYV